MKGYQMNKRILLCFVESILVLVSCVAHGRTATPPHSPWTPQAWLTRPWTGDDKPYRAIREHIEAAVAHGEAPKAIAQRYQVPAQRNRLDAQAQFAWAYSAHKVFLANPAVFADASALDALSTTGVEDVYEYTRLRFMLTQEINPNTNNLYLKNLGERLLKRDPDDKRVRQDLVYALCTDKRGLSDALRIAQEGVRRHPEDAKLHATVASAYQSIFDWSRARDSVARDNAVAEYKKYLQLAPQSDYFRKYAAFRINALPQEKPW